MRKFRPPCSTGSCGRRLTRASTASASKGTCPPTTPCCCWPTAPAGSELPRKRQTNSSGRSAPSTPPDLLRLDKLQRRRIDAVALVRRRRPVVEDVTQVGVAVAAEQFRPHGEPAAILGGGDRLRVDRRPKARPASAGLELRLR